MCLPIVTDGVARSVTIMSPAKTAEPIKMPFGLVGWLEFNVPFQHKYGYIRDDAIWDIMTTTVHLSI